MDRIRLVGGNELRGEIPISGAKNAALPLMIASLLTDEPLILENVPRLADVKQLERILENHGVDIAVHGRRRGEAEGVGQRMTFTAADIVDTTAPYELVSKMRASFWVIGPLLAREHNAACRCPAAAPSARARSTCSCMASSNLAPRSRSTRAMSSPRRPRAASSAIRVVSPR
jgi:UDP-N-acetylglucosamine 1-carboxyvinyltransferase